MIAEVIGGFVTNSLALLHDVGHMLSDVVSLALSLLAFKLREKMETNVKTYGYKRFGMLAASYLCYFYILFIEAIRRFKEPVEIASNGMLTIAILGLLINVTSARILMRDGDMKDNLNLRSAFLHVLGDLSRINCPLVRANNQWGFVGAIIAALLSEFLGWNAADPIASINLSSYC